MMEIIYINKNNTTSRLKKRSNRMKISSKYWDRHLSCRTRYTSKILEQNVNVSSEVKR